MNTYIHTYIHTYQLQVQVQTEDQQTYSARSVVFCGGSWMSSFLEKHGLKIPTRITMETVSIRDVCVYVYVYFFVETVWLCACMYVYIHTYIHTYDTDLIIPAQARMSYRCAHTNTYIHTCIHTYINTYTGFILSAQARVHY